MRVRYTMIDDVSLSSTIETIAGTARAIIPLVREAKSEGLDTQQIEFLNEKITDIQDALLVAQGDSLTAQEMQFKLVARIKEFEHTIAEFEDWETEKKRFTLVNVGSSGGVLVHLLRHDAAHDDEPSYYICPRCYQNRVKSILQRDRVDGTMKSVCPECNSNFKIDYQIGRSHGVFR